MEEDSTKLSIYTISQEVAPDPSTGNLFNNGTRRFRQHLELSVITGDWKIGFLRKKK